MTEPTLETEIFRSTALESYASTSRFEETLRVVSYRGWITKLSFWALALGILFWFFLGSIPIETQGVAVAINQGGLFNLETSFNGIVKSIHFSTESDVKKGDLLVVLDNPNLDARLKTIQQTVERLQSRLEYLQREITTEKKEVIASLEKGVAAAEFKIHILEKDIPILEEDVSLKQHVAEKGLLDTQSLQQTLETFWTKQIELEKAKADLQNLHFRLKQEYRADEILSLKERLREVSNEKAAVEAEFQYHHIYSPIQGKILEWFVQPGNDVSSGQLIARLELDGGQLNPKKTFYGYLPLEDRKIALNALVKIELANIKALEYGAILGHLTHISPQAVSPEFLNEMIHDPALIDYLLHKKTAVFQVIIEPQFDSSTPSGYRWTSGAGPDVQVSSGTLALFNGLIEEVTPFNYFFPVWWIREKIY